MLSKQDQETLVWMAKKDEEVAEAKHERDEVLARHARILSWPTADVASAYADILRIGASLARVGSAYGPDLRSAVDTIQKYVSQVKAQQDDARTAESPNEADIESKPRPETQSGTGVDSPESA